MFSFLFDDKNLSLNDAFRARVTAVFSLSLAVWAPVYSLIMYRLAPHPEVVWSTMICMVMVGVSPLLLRWGASFRVVGNWLAFNVFWEMLFVAGFAGYGPPPLFWLAVVPMLALVIAGVRSGIFWLVADLVALGGYYLYVWDNAEVALVLSPEEHRFFEATVLGGLYLLIMCMAMGYEKVKNGALAQMRASEERARAILENAGDAILTVTQDDTVENNNQAACQVFGYSVSQMKGRAFTELVPAVAHPPPAASRSQEMPLTVDAPDDESQAGVSLHQWTGQKYESVAYSADGRAFPIELSVARLHRSADDRFVVVLRDITDRKRFEAQQERALRRSKESFRALIENLPDGLFVHRDGIIQYLNPSAEKMLRYDRRQALVGSPIDQIIPEAEADLFAQHLNRARSEVSAAHEAELHLEARDGARIAVESMSFQANFQGEPALISIVRDLTERKKMKTRMMQMERLSAVGTLAAGVAHEINNPLTFVRGNLDFLARRVAWAMDQFEGASASGLADSGARVHAEMHERGWDDVLEDALEGTDRIRDIVSDLSTFSRQRDIKSETADPVEVIESAINMAHSEVKHRAQLVRDFEPVSRVDIDQASLGQIVLNLIVNAAQAMPERSTTANKIQTSVYEEGDEVVIEVSDNGVGIPDYELAQVFDPFYSTKTEERGMGLGLSICQNIAQRVGGELSVESEVGVGSTFRLRLPAAPDASVADAHSEAAELEASDAEGPRTSVLIVDDEKLVARALSRVLGDSYEVEDVQQARRALTMIASEGRRFDVILCDLMMLEMSGVDFFERLQAIAPALAERVIFITGGAVTGRARDFLEQTQCPVLMKPIDHGELEAQVEELLASS